MAKDRKRTLVHNSRKIHYMSVYASIHDCVYLKKKNSFCADEAHKCVNLGTYTCLYVMGHTSVYLAPKLYAHVLRLHVM